MPKRNKYKDEFKWKIEKIRIGREKRDRVFNDLSENAVFETWDKLRNWIKEEIDDIEAYLGGLEPLTRDDIGRSFISSLWDELHEINSGFEKYVLNLPPDPSDSAPSHLKMDKMSVSIATNIIPLVRGLMRLRKHVHSAYQALFPSSS